MGAGAVVNLFRRAFKRALRRCLQGLLFGLFTLLGLGSAVGRAFRRTKPIEADNLRRILVIRLDLLGDLVMSLPAVHALKQSYPNASVTVLALPYAAGLLKLAPEVDATLAFDVNLIRRPAEVLRPSNYRAFFGLVRQLRRERFDLCLSLHGQFACVMAWLSGCRRRYGYRREAYPFMLTNSLPGGRYGVRQHEVLYNLALAQLAGAKLPEGKLLGTAYAPHLAVPAREQRQTKQLLAEFEVRPETLLVVIHPGASNGSAKRWMPAGWGQVANGLHSDLRAAIALTGTAAEADVVREVERACDFRPIIMAGQTSIPQLAALLKRADLLLTGDTGPAHLAAALGTPIVSVFGPTDPLVYAPFTPRVAVLRRDLSCSPCYVAKATAECPYGHVNCMRELQPEEVYQASRRMLQKRVQQVQP
ncbi:MAG: lipopolysaccharide heptosyltransferase II [Chloroflexota bacterium]|nr:lipopolysaccharide heptosyltransferase II [Chloroflexota bacterium]